MLKAYQPVYEQEDTTFADRRLDWRAKALKGEEMSVNLIWLCELDLFLVYNLKNFSYVI